MFVKINDVSAIAKAEIVKVTLTYCTLSIEYKSNGMLIPLDIALDHTMQAHHVPIVLTELLFWLSSAMQATITIKQFVEQTAKGVEQQSHPQT